jgi:hypothetical protein
MQAIGLLLAEIGWAIAGLGVGGYTAVAIGAAVVVGGSIAAAKAMGLFEIEMPQMDSDASRQTTLKSTVAPQKIIYGEALVSGPISYIALAGANNADLYQTIVLAGHKVNAITNIHFDDEVITNAQIAAGLNTGSNTAGNVTGGTFGPINSNTICIINKHLGTASEASDPMLTNKFDLYTSAHRGEGIAYLAMKWTLDEDSAEVWEKYSPGNVKALVQGKQVYDPRLEVTAGGTAGANPTTAAYVVYSTNPALCVTDYLIDQNLGMGIAANKIDWATVITAANGCDVDVNVPNNATQKRFTANGVLFATDSHQKNINKLLSSMNGRLIYSNGKYIVKAGIYEEPTEVLTEDDLIGAIQIKTSLERSDRFNTIRGIFVDAAANNKSTEFPKVQLADAKTRDNNEVLEKEIQLPMVSDSYQAQRIANKLIQLSDQQKIVSFPANLSALRITAGDRVQVTVSELGWANKVFECIGWTFSDDGGVNLTLREDSFSSYGDPLPAAYSQITSDGVIADGFRGVPSPSGLRAASGEKKVFLNWVNPGKPSDFGTIEIYASASNNIANAVKIGETDGTQFVHDGNNAADQIAVDDTRVYWVRSKKNVGTVADDAVSLYQPNSTTGVGPVTVLATLVDWDNVANPTIGIDINNSDEISINLGVANTTTGQAVAQSGISEDVTITQGGIRMNQGGSIRGGQTAYNSGEGFFLGYDSSKYKLSIRNSTSEALTFDGDDLTITGTVNASAGAFTGDVSTDSKFIAGSGATSATMDGDDQNYKFYAGAATAGASPFKVDASGTVTADRIVITRPDDPSAIIFDSAQDGLVGIGLSRLSSETDNAVAEVADELTSNSDYSRFIVSTTQTVTIKTLFPLGYLPFAVSSAEDFPDSITLTLQRATITNGVVGTFANISLGSKTFTRRVFSAGAASDDDYYSVYDSGTGWYAKGKDAVDGQFNLVYVKDRVFTPGDWAYRVQVSFVAGSGSGNGNPSTSASRTLFYTSDSQYFTVDSLGIIRDQSPGSILTGDVILSGSSGVRTISWRDSDNQDENWAISGKVGYGESGANQLNFTFDNGSTQPISFISNGNILTTGDFYTSAAVTAGTASFGGGYGSTGTSITATGDISTDGNVIIGGNLTVQGTTTTINVADLTVADKDITLNYSTGDSSATANNAGIIIQDAVNSTTDASILWKTASDTFEFSHAISTKNATFDNGTNTTVDVIADDDGMAQIRLYGAAQGTGRLFVGQDTNYGGGIEYNGDNSPSTTGAGADYIALFRNAVGTLAWTARNYYDSNDWEFRGNITANSNLYLRSSGGEAGIYLQDSSASNATAFKIYADVTLATSTLYIDYDPSVAGNNWAFVNNGNFLASGTIYADGAASNSLQWEAGYDYSQVGHLPLAGGTVSAQTFFLDDVAWKVSGTDAAYQRADARDDATSFARLHWYGVADNSATSNFRHAWYDGSAYIFVTAASGTVTFGGDIAATNVYVADDLRFTGTDNFIWSPDTTSGLVGFYDPNNNRIAAKYQNDTGGWGLLGEPASGYALKVHGAISSGSIESGAITSISVIGAADDVRTGLRHYDSTAMAAGVGGQLILGYKYLSTGGYTAGAILKTYKENATSNHYGSGLKFQVRNHGYGLSTKMTLNPSGNLSVTGGIQSFGPKTQTEYPDGILTITDTTAVATGVGGGILFSGKYSGTTVTTTGSIDTRKDNATAGQFGFSMVFNTRLNGGANTTALTLGSNQSATFAGTVTATQDAYVDNNLHVGKSGGWLQFYDDSGVGNTISKGNLYFDATTKEFRFYSAVLSTGAAESTATLKRYNGSAYESIYDTGSGVPWADINAGVRTNFTIGFKPAASNYAGLLFQDENAGLAGYLLVRANSDVAPTYKANGVHLIADAGYLSLISRTTSNTGVRILSGAVPAERMVFKSDGEIDQPNAIWKRTYHQENRYASGHTANMVHTHWGVLAAGSHSGTPSTYTIVQTNVSQDAYRMGGFTLLVMDAYADKTQRERIDLAGYWNPESNGGFLGWGYTTTNPSERPTIQVMRNSSTGKVAFAYSHASGSSAGSYPVIVACDLWLGYANAIQDDGRDWSMIGASNLTGYTNIDTVTYAGGDGNYQKSDGQFVIHKSNGSMLSHGSYSDAIGYNASYGTYIGANSRYVYSGIGTHPVFSDGTAHNITHNGGQIANTYNGDHTFTTTTTNAGIKVTNNQSGGPALKIHNTATDGTDWWLISNGASNEDGAGKLQLWSHNNSFTCATFGETSTDITKINTQTQVQTTAIPPNFTSTTSGAVTPALLANSNGFGAHALVVNQTQTTHWAQIISTQGYGLFIDNHASSSSNDLFRTAAGGTNQFVIRGDGRVFSKQAMDVGDAATYGLINVNADGSSGGTIDSWAPNGSQVHQDIRNNGTWSMAHKYTYKSGNGYGQYAESWWDGSSYHQLASIDNAIRTNGDFVASGNITAYGSFSDIRLKENIVPFVSAREAIAGINTYKFNYKGKADTLIGVIAQEVEKTLPELTYELIDDDKEVRKAVRYDHLSAVLLQAVKEQDEEIKELKEMVKQLMEKIQ